MTLFSATLLLFLVIDPIGNVPFFLAALKPVAPERHARIVVRELLVALLVLVLFLFAGPLVLEAVGISEPSLSVAGGIVLFLIAIRMVFPAMRGAAEATLDAEPFIVPLAIPYVAGPSAMSALLLISSREPERRLEWLLALLLAWAVSSAMIYLGSRLRRFLGDRGLIALERLMGMLLVALAVEMLLDGVARFVAGL